MRTNMVSPDNKIRFSWFTFYSLVAFWNWLSIIVFVRIESGNLPLWPVGMGAAVVLVNLALIGAYCSEGRPALKKVPAIAAAFAMIYAVVGIVLSNYYFGVPILEPIYRIAQMFVGESSWIDRVLRETVATQSPLTLAITLNIARLAALLATVSGALVLIKRLTDEFKARALWDKGHVVLCRLGESGMEFARKWHEVSRSDRNEHDQRLLIIEFPYYRTTSLSSACCAANWVMQNGRWQTLFSQHEQFKNFYRKMAGPAYT